MSANQQPWPGATDDRLAQTNWAGLMARWLASDATHGGFAFSGTGKQRRIYVPLATASLAGAMTPAHFSKLATWPLARLQYALAADTWNATALTAGTQNDANANQNFTVNSTASVLLFDVRMNVLFNATGAGIAEVAVRANIDSAGTPVLVKLSADGGPNTLWSTAGGSWFWLAGFAAGTHTIKIQCSPNVNGNAYLRAAGVPATEFLTINILELNP